MDVGAAAAPIAPTVNSVHLMGLAASPLVGVSQIFVAESALCGGIVIAGLAIQGTAHNSTFGLRIGMILTVSEMAVVVGAVTSRGLGGLKHGSDHSGDAATRL